jgi:hypothetical protein
LVPSPSFTAEISAISSCASSFLPTSASSAWRCDWGSETQSLGQAGVRRFKGFAKISMHGPRASRVRRMQNRRNQMSPIRHAVPDSFCKEQRSPVWKQSGSP